MRCFAHGEQKRLRQYAGDKKEMDVQFSECAKFDCPYYATKIFNAHKFDERHEYYCKRVAQEELK